MRLPRSDSAVKDMLVGIEITLIGLVVASQSYFFEYSAVVGNGVVIVGLWVTVSGYYSEKGTE